MISHVRGIFKTFDASIYTTGKDFTNAEIDIWMDASSVSTGDAGRDEHLKSEDFLNIEAHQQIRFTANTLERSDTPGPGMYDMWGELTMAGVTKKIKLLVRFGGIVNDPSGKERAGFTVTGKINRKDWGLSWNTILEAGGMLVSEDVAITCDIELINIGYKDLKMELEGSFAAELS